MTALLQRRFTLVTTTIKTLTTDETPIVRMENRFLQLDVAPRVGGRVTSVVEASSGHQFLWRNANLRLQRLAPGTAYDPNFYGGIDELLPNDIPEPLNGVDSPDHGELWTTAFDYEIEDGALTVLGTFPLCGLAYRRRISLRTDGPTVDTDYHISNPTSEARIFLWKLHAALNIEPGDRILCPARVAQVPDLEWSRWHSLEPFHWPFIEGQRADQIPPKDGTVDFLYLFDLEAGEIGWRRPAQGLEFSYRFDLDVFPYAWLFASYGGFDDHYVAILEPCTTMPISVSEAAGLGQCSVLAPGEALETRVTTYAGPSRE
jgi:hypothetical protein